MSDRSVDSATARVLRALAGETVVPPVTGITFVEPGLLGFDGGEGAAPAARLAATCADAGLDFAFVPSWEPWALEAVSVLASAGVACLWVVPGVCWPTLESVGVASALRAAAHGPSELDEPLDAALARCLRAADAGIRAGVDALVVADDLAGSAGPLLDPIFLRAAVFPRLAVAAAAAESVGVPAILHSDGDVRGLMSAIATSGFVALHGDAGGGRYVEDSLAAARAAGLVMIGGIPTAALADHDGAVAAGARAGALAFDDGLLVADDGGVSTVGEARALLGALERAHAQERNGSASAG